MASAFSSIREWVNIKFACSAFIYYVPLSAQGEVL